MTDWIKICELGDILPLGSRVVELPTGPVAIFRTADDEVFTIEDSCPHKQGPLSQGIVHGKSLTCPLHNWVIGLESGAAVAPDIGCTKTFATQLKDGVIYLETVTEFA